MRKTILILAANPKDTPQLRLDQEVREIENGLERAQEREEFILKQKWAARPVDVRRAMLDFNPNIVHFCGHGSGEEGIAFEDEMGQAKFVNANALEGFFKLFSDKVECVVLNACYSEVQAKAIAKHIPYVLGMSKTIADQSAIEFSVAFYDALGAGKTFEFAYELACNAIQWENMADNLIPILIIQNQNKHIKNELAEKNKQVKNKISDEKIKRKLEEGRITKGQAELKREGYGKNKEMVRNATIGDLKTVSEEKSNKKLCEKCNTVIDEPPQSVAGCRVNIIMLIIGGVIGLFTAVVYEEVPWYGIIAGIFVGAMFFGSFLASIVNKFKFSHDPIICPKCGHINYKGRTIKK